MLVIRIFSLFFVLSHVVIHASLEKSDTKEQYSYLLGCSVGGVTTEIGLFKARANHLELVHQIVKNSKELPTQDALNNYLAQQVQALRKQYQINISYACFAVSGPAQEKPNIIQSSHMNYPVDGELIAKQAKLCKVMVVNDFEVSGYGLPFLTQYGCELIHNGLRQEHKPKALIGVGTGLGSSLCVPNATNGYSVFPMGLNMTAFCPLNERDVKFFEFLKSRQPLQEPHVGWGTALGAKGGLAALFQCFYDAKSVLTAQDIFAKARERKIDDMLHKNCVAAVDQYMKLYARAIKTFALFALPYGGIYITNTVAQENPELIRSPKFITDILSCGNPVLDEIVARIPLYLITDPGLAIRGAAARMMQCVSPS